MERQIKDNVIMRKVKSIWAGYMTGNATQTGTVSISESKLLDSHENVFESKHSGRQTPESPAQIMPEDVLRRRLEEQAVLENSPKLQRLLGAETSPKAERVLGGTELVASGLGSPDFGPGSPSRQRLPTIIDNSPKLQKFFGTSPTASPPGRRKETGFRATGSPPQRRRTIHELRRGETHCAVEESLLPQLPQRGIGLGISEMPEMPDTPETPPRTTPPSPPRLSRPFQVSREESGKSDFSDFNFFPDQMKPSPAVSRYSIQVSGLRQHANVMEFSEPPDRIKNTDEWHKKRDGIALSRSPIKRINSHQYEYTPDSVRTWGASLSTNDQEATNLPTEPPVPNDELPSINIQRASDMSRRTSDVSKRNSADAGLLIDSPPSTKKSRIFTVVGASPPTASSQANILQSSFDQDYRFPLEDGSPVMMKHKFKGVIQTTVRSPRTTLDNDRMSHVDNPSSEALSQASKLPKELRRMSMPLNSSMRDQKMVGMGGGKLGHQSSKSGSGLGGDYVVLKDAPNTPGTSMGRLLLLPSPKFGREDRAGMGEGQSFYDDGDEDELQEGHGGLWGGRGD